MILKLTILLAVFYCFTNFASSRSIDSRRVYHAISSGKGLYSPTDKLTILVESNFKEHVIGKSNAWLVEFYNSWCGHCIQFSPIYREFAASVAPWNNVVKIGAVDCSNEENSDVCREYEIMAYPTLRYFLPHHTVQDYGNDMDRSYSATGLRKKLIKKLLNTTAEPGWPSFAAYDSPSVFDVWSKVPSSVKYVLLFVEAQPTENEETYATEIEGIESILDMSAVSEVYATRVSSDKPAARQLKLSQLPGIAVLTRDNDIIPLTSDLSDNSRDNRLEAVLKYLQLQGVNIPFSTSDKDEGNDSDAVDVLNVIEEEQNRPDQGDIVYQIDLETALRYSLEQDIPMKGEDIDSERLEALKAYVKVLIKYFPFDDKGRKFLNVLNETVAAANSFTPVEFQQTVTSLMDEHKPFLVNNKEKTGFIGCASRFPGLRGYTCTLWTLFHTLTVAADSKPHLSSDPKEVLHAMQGYIKNFFSCTYCAENFAKEIGNLEESVNSLDDSVLYLWKTHNHVNHRLHQYPGNITEDPDHPKIQFPSIAHCPKCYTSSGDWNQTAVLDYLKNIYTKISFKAITESFNSHTQAKREVGKSRATPLVIDTRYFNMFDISLCVVLYFASAGILLLVGLKFFLKKSVRRKHYIYDILSRA